MKSENILLTQITDQLNSNKKSLFKKKKKLKEKIKRKLLLTDDCNDQAFNIIDKEHDIKKLENYYISQIAETKQEINILYHSQREKRKMIKDMDEKIQSEIISSNRLEISQLKEYYEREIRIMESKL